MLCMVCWSVLCVLLLLHIIHSYTVLATTVILYLRNAKQIHSLNWLHQSVSKPPGNNFNTKILIWNSVIDFFILAWQDTEPVPCTDFLKMKSLDSTCFKTA